MVSRVVLSFERVLYVWLLYAYVCAGVDESLGSRLPFCAGVFSRVCVHAYARVRVRVLVYNARVCMFFGTCLRSFCVFA